MLISRPSSLLFILGFWGYCVGMACTITPTWIELLLSLDRVCFCACCSNVHVCVRLHCQDCWHRGWREGAWGNIQCLLWRSLSDVVSPAILPNQYLCFENWKQRCMHSAWSQWPLPLEKFPCRHPMKYAAMLAERMQEHGTTAWLINTGWTGGG